MSATHAALVEALELIAASMRPDGTWNRDRLACQQLARAALAAAEAPPPAVPQWQPIETAPKDGQWFVTARFVEGEKADYEIGAHAPMSYPDYEPTDDGSGLFKRVTRVIYEWAFFNNFPRMTHWMPLPAAPTAKQREGE